ncbi:MAG: hypothetical protein A3C93_01625 [Candidatus Lloydbacteria bacterium RIFCSPHIGHO2_02_FULL_54_17]|uniref:Uncharacterized protein n=1 Tax=Candidatus Lloydbacteria bacterium RIFCSPHIGHO2_02_FULL_54_17 TaxID=1798664 RepID=A0A1G2DBR4_9BACT|nr:MAG: hypothetical protein A3C93_01625 [Candidatus Lloydbacteria bacterium RIFCSPHIGHO2_02_FULL_54_17]OGZ14453.1 MAG: hypothetical protein A3H76_06140 [Candidatus Lloydbacteria bacterium RIFCSPLOWO2_02_FULL_54_12]OGZ15469.1 MAG: hypothetical protein A2948_02745 [Candidatus Lloydbacteria bacterium RIFCSPLOWO2_01_FULL_54_18]
MDEFFKMDIFFVVATAAVFLGMVLCAVAMLYIIKILKNIDHITENVSEESDEMRGDIAILRSKIRQEGVKFRHFSEFFTNFVSRRKSRKKT